MAEMPQWAKELRKTRMELGLTQEELANLLGIKRGKIVNIENGRIKNPPAGLLEAVDNLRDDMQKNAPLLDKFDRPMNEIIAEWMQRLGMERESELAEFLNVTPYSIKRWKTGEVRPLTQVIFEYERMISLMESNIEKWKEKSFKKGAQATLNELEEYLLTVQDPEIKDHVLKMIIKLQDKLGI